MKNLNYAEKRYRDINFKKNRKRSTFGVACDLLKLPTRSYSFCLYRLSIMAWQRPGYILQTVRSGCQLHISLPGRQPSILSPSLLYPVTKKPQLPRRQRQFSTQPARRNASLSPRDSVEKPAPAAAPINFDDPSSVPARIIPASPAYFSGSPKFIDNVLQLQHLQSKYASLPTLEPSDAPRRAWLKLAQFRVKLNEEVPSAKYKRFIKILQRLNRIHPNLVPSEVQKAMTRWLRPGNPYQIKPISTELDALGRSRGVGRRKASSATAWLVEGEGEVLINGKSLLQVFPRLHDRESALWALRSTMRLDKYNVWALAQGGGVTGQAEAITLAVARALMVHEPALKPILRRGMSFLFFPVSSYPNADANHYHSHYSWRYYKRSSTGGEEEAWPRESQEDAHLGQEMRSGTIPLLSLSFTSTLLLY